MQTVNITISKDALVKSVENLLWKYGKAIEGADNYKQVYNVQSEHGKHHVDNKVLSDSFVTRSREVIDILRDYMTGDINYDSTTGDHSVTMYMSARWKGRQSTLQSMVDKYVSDGMMADWLNVTAPKEAEIYYNKVAVDGNEISSNIHSLGRPSIS